MTFVLGACDEELWADSHWWECLCPWVSRTVSTQSEAWGLENQDLALGLCLCTRVWVWELEGSAFKVPRDMMASEGPPKLWISFQKSLWGPQKGWRTKSPCPPMIPWTCGPGNVVTSFRERIKGLLLFLTCA